jgi:hypothetical protein
LFGGSTAEKGLTEMTGGNSTHLKTSPGERKTEGGNKIQLNKKANQQVNQILAWNKQQMSPKSEKGGRIKGPFGRAFPSASPLAFTEALPNP